MKKRFSVLLIALFDGVLPGRPLRPGRPRQIRQASLNQRGRARPKIPTLRNLRQNRRIAFQDDRAPIPTKLIEDLNTGHAETARASTCASASTRSSTPENLELAGP